MTGNARGGGRILGSLRSADGKGIVRMEDRFDTDIGDLWSALTDPGRLARWYGRGRGRPAPRGRVPREPSGRRGTHRAGRRMRAAAAAPGHAARSRGSAGPAGRDGHRGLARRRRDQTVLVVEQRGLPLPLLAAYGAGVQIHVEHLAAHLAGGEPDHTETRWDELLPAYQALAASQA